ncbi:lipopeptide mating pheromone precursor bap3-1 [Schizophyllum commune H4-8]|uniref:Lipopeptide mating pheromone bap3-1 n=2 Tax=Schizophyllum commune TaxID=5334 RepID=D8QF47_SCHCM|nr:lipopeptide mating pheromone precursor bap3-1 [Schizophyllum commune H4-8]AAR99649.1 lipopeptide mating pheromone precursor Bap3(1) [Schizophyllum commune]KAI5887478.1 lipopeptide mating pheromone precursor bap3-1 [Schizophyllum commune H4-8]
MDAFQSILDVLSAALDEPVDAPLTAVAQHPDADAVFDTPTDFERVGTGGTATAFCVVA